MNPVKFSDRDSQGTGSIKITGKSFVSDIRESFLLGEVRKGNK